MKPEGSDLGGKLLGMILGGFGLLDLESFKCYAYWRQAVHLAAHDAHMFIKGNPQATNK